MYFTSEKNEAIIEIIKTRIEDIQFEIPLTKAFFPYHDSMNAKKHNHANFEVFFNKRSKGKMLVQNTVIEFADNSMVIIAPQVYHAYKPDEMQASEVVKYTLKFNYTPSEKADELFERFSFRYVENIENVFDTIESIHDAYGTDTFGAKQKIASLFCVLLIEVLREISKKTLEEKRKDVDANRGDYKVIEVAQIEAFFEKNYNAFPSPADLARHLSVSTRQLDRILKQHFAMSFSAKLVSTKTELAKDLLKSTDLSVASISEKLGYLSPASFSAVFKKQTGVSPNSFRKQ